MFYLAEYKFLSEHTVSGKTMALNNGLYRATLAIFENFKNLLVFERI